MGEDARIEFYWPPEWPGGPTKPALRFEERGFGPDRVVGRFPLLATESLTQLLSALRTRGVDTLRRFTVREITEAIEAATRELVEPGKLHRQELVETLPRLTGYSPRMIEIGLERMGANWTSIALREALVREFGSLEVLDDFQPCGQGRHQKAFGPGLTVHIFSGNIPGVAVTSLIRALCVKSPSFGKTAAGEPYSAVCFARALASVSADLASCLAVTYWPGGSKELERAAFAAADAVVAYGSDDTIDEISGLVPSHCRLLRYPNRFGVAVISGKALSEGSPAELALAVAKDVSTFDQQGCVSPHAVFVEEGGDVSAVDFGRLLADAMESVAKEVPRGAARVEESSLIHQVRGQAEMRGAEVITSHKGTEWTVIVERRDRFEPSPLNRVIHVTAVGELNEALTALESVGRHLQTVAIGAVQREVEALAERLGSIGATRLVPVGEAAWPAADWRHDGRYQFADLVRFVDLEI
jgi:hypothetical protein